MKNKEHAAHNAQHKAHRTTRAAQVPGAKQVVPQLSGANGFCGRFRVPMVPGHTDLVGELAKFDNIRGGKSCYKWA